MITHRSWLATLAAAWLLIGVSVPASAEVLSRRLLDVIKSNGEGNINLFKLSGSRPDLSGADLEAFRLDNNGELVFAVDVNEAANGTEKASSQGVTIKSAVLTVVVDGVPHTFSNYWTRTQTLVAERGASTRDTYFTLLGDSGSSRITSSTDSDLYNSDFDANIYFQVDLDLSQATSASLAIVLLDTDVVRGDPEAFYDFSNGFEDIAIVSRQDAELLDAVAAGAQEAPLVLLTNEVDNTPSSALYYPSSTTYYLSAFEDRFPNKGDYDFNDAVIAYRVWFSINSRGRVIGIHAVGYLLARGAAYDADWYLRIPVQTSVSGEAIVKYYSAIDGSEVSDRTYSQSVNGDITLRALQGLKGLLVDPNREYVNTIAGSSYIASPKFSIDISLDQEVNMNQIGQAPFDPFLHVINTNYEIHQAGFSARLNESNNVRNGHNTFIDQDGYPFALVFPDEWAWPIEYEDLGNCYDDFLNFVLSDGSALTDWYRRPNANRTRSAANGYWKW